MTDNELLLAISSMLDKKMEPIESRMKSIEITLENAMLPRLQTIESCYISTYNRYQNKNEQIDAMQDDINLIKKVVTNHSERLQKIS